MSTFELFNASAMLTPTLTEADPPALPAGAVPPFVVNTMYTIRRNDGLPNLEGNIDEPNWQNANLWRQMRYLGYGTVPTSAEHGPLYLFWGEIAKGFTPEELAEHTFTNEATGAVVLEATVDAPPPPPGMMAGKRRRHRKTKRRHTTRKTRRSRLTRRR
jgi:hypothetical protein